MCLLCANKSFLTKHKAVSLWFQKQRCLAPKVAVAIASSPFLATLGEYCLLERQITPPNKGKTCQVSLTPAVPNNCLDTMLQ